jgi:hypothetical protein
VTRAVLRRISARRERRFGITCRFAATRLSLTGRQVGGGHVADRLPGDAEASASTCRIGARRLTGPPVPTSPRAHVATPGRPVRLPWAAWAGSGAHGLQDFTLDFGGGLKADLGAAVLFSGDFFKASRRRRHPVPCTKRLRGCSLSSNLVRPLEAGRDGPRQKNGGSD